MHVQMPSANCMCGVLSHSVTTTAKHVTQRRDPTPVLRQAVQTAQRKLLLSDHDLADVNEALARLFAELAPIHDELAATADRTGRLLRRGARLARLRRKEARPG